MFEGGKHFHDGEADIQLDSYEIRLQKPKFPEYSELSKRLESFNTWSDYLPVKPENLAEAGFIYTGVDDSVRCYHCGGGLRHWESGDKPWAEHAKCYPTCPHVLLLKGQNYVTAFKRGETPEDNYEMSNLQKPMFPQHATTSKRLESFSTWPKYVALKPECLAEAGFFYAGVGDNVTCYHCGGSIRNWETEDDPWMEHASLFPGCPYVIFVKGQSYVDAIGRGEKSDESVEMVFGETGNNTAVQSCLQMGFSEKIVREATAIFIRKYGHSNFKGEELCEIALDIEDSHEVSQSPDRDSCLSKEDADDLLLVPCTLCSDGTADTVCLPCGHLVCCSQCVVNLNCCPVCDNAVKGYYKTYDCECDETGLPSKDGGMDHDYGIESRDYGIDDDEDSVEVNLHRWWKPWCPLYMSIKSLRSACCCCRPEEEDVKSLV